MGAQNVHFAPNFPQSAGFQPQVLHFGRKFLDKRIRRQFSDTKKFRGEGSGNAPPPSPLPRRH